MQQSRSNGDPAFDEDSDFTDTPLPSQMFTDIGSSHGHDEDVETWAEETIGDTHLGKRKTKIGPEMRKGKKPRTEEELGSDDTTPEPSGGEDIGDDDDDDSSSSEGDGNDGNDSGGSGGDEGGGADTSGYRIAPTIRFTGEEDFTHATQDTDHGAPTSQRQTTSTSRHGRQAPLAYDEDSSNSASSGQYYNPYSTSPPAGGFLWPPPGVVNPPLPQAVAALPYLDYHGYLPYGAPQLQYHPPTYVYLPPTDEPYEGPPGERFED